MEVTIRIGDWATLGRDAKTVRYAVFVIGQNIPVELEWDEMDSSSLHAVAYDGTARAIGTARLLPDQHIGRMAVLEHARGRGIGGLLLRAMMETARERGAREVVLNAQVAAMPFYRRHGFVEEGEEFDDAGIPHKLMRYAFAKP